MFSKPFSSLILLSLAGLATLPISKSFAEAPLFPPLSPSVSQQPRPNIPAYPGANRFIPPGTPYGVAPQTLPFQRPMAYPQAAPQALAVQPPVNQYSGYLGIGVDIIPSSVAAQMPEGTSQAQGILVKQFSPDSPAETSNLKPFDVILTYDGTPINHPAQFIEKVRKDKPGRQVNMKIIRKGKIMEVPVTIGAQKTPDPRDYNALAIKQTGKDKYLASIRFISPTGTKQTRSFQGTREEIFEQVMMTQDLPRAEREQLLMATQPRPGSSNGTGFGSFMPFGKNESGKEWMNPGRFFKW